MPERSYYVDISQELHDVLKKYAKQQRRTINNQVEVILESFLRRKEKQMKKKGPTQ